MPPVIPAGRYQAFRTKDGLINVYDDGVLLFSLPADFPTQFIKTVCCAYDEGIAAGIQHVMAA
jgi:hypothetical protein